VALREGTHGVAHYNGEAARESLSKPAPEDTHESDFNAIP